MDGQNNMNMGEGSNQAPRNGSAGPIIGVIVILIIIILGGLYFWNERANNMMDGQDTMESTDAETNSDDEASIEADLDATDIENIDAELNAS